MRELSLHILDIAENSVKAHASSIQIQVVYRDKCCQIIIEDNGIGMSKELAESATNPFVTTKHGAKVGLGLGLFKQLAESTGGSFNLSSAIGVGTKVEVLLCLDSVNMLPMGDLPATISALLSDKCDICLLYQANNKSFAFDTKTVKELLGNIPIDTPQIQTFIKSMLKENIDSINGGIVL